MYKVLFLAALCSLTGCYDAEHLGLLSGQLSEDRPTQ